MTHKLQDRLFFLPTYIKFETEDTFKDKDGQLNCLKSVIEEEKEVKKIAEPPKVCEMAHLNAMSKPVPLE